MNQSIYTSAPPTSDMASEKTAAAAAATVVVSQATPVSRREMEAISESDSDSEGEDAAPVSCPWSY